MGEYLNSIDRVFNSLKKWGLELSGRLTRRLNTRMLLALGAGEIVSREFFLSNEGNVLALALYAMTSLPMNAIPSSDSHKSFGFWQTLKGTFNNIVKKYGKFFPPEERNFEGCISFACQSKVAILLAYDNLKRLEDFLDKNENFINSWPFFAPEERDRFVMFLLAAMHNYGYSRVETAVKKAFSKQGRFNEIMERLKSKLPQNVGDYAQANVNAYNSIKWFGPSKIEILGIRIMPGEA